MRRLAERIVEEGCPGLGERRLSWFPSALHAREFARLLLEKRRAWIGIETATTRTLFESLAGTPLGDAFARTSLEAWVAKRASLSRNRASTLLRTLQLLRRFGYAEDADLPAPLRAKLPEGILRDFARLFETPRRRDLAAVLGGGGIPEPPAEVLAFLPGFRLTPEAWRLASHLEEAGKLRVAPSPEGGRPRFSFFSAQGEERELREACARARALIDEGLPPHSIALVPLSWERYAGFLPRVCEEEGLPFFTPRGRSPAGTPSASFLRALAEVCLRNAPRPAVLRLFSHPFFRSPEGDPDADGRLLRATAAFDRRSRERGLTGGFEALGALLSGRGFPEREGARILRARLEACRRIGEVYARRPGEAIGEFAKLAEDFRAGGGGPESPPLEWEAIERALASFGELDELGLTFPAASEFPSVLQARLGEFTIPLEGLAPEGVRVLGLPRALGLPLEAVFVLGLGRDRFPSPPPGNPWMQDAAREALRKDLRARGLRLPEVLAARGLLAPPLAPREEEDLQLRELEALCAGVPRCTLSWVHADLQGRLFLPSAWLARKLRALRAHPREEGSTVLHLSAAPDKLLASRLRRHRELPPEPAALHAAFSLEEGEREKALRAALSTSPRRGPDPERLLEGLRCRTRLESFRAGGAGPFDPWSLRGSDPPRLTFKVTAFEGLGRCPLQFFFQEVLRLAPLDEEPREDRVSARLRGSAAHRVLETLFRPLLTEGPSGISERAEDPLLRYLQLRAAEKNLGHPSPDRGKARLAVLRHVETICDQEADQLLSPLMNRLPLFRRIGLEQWTRAIAEAVLLDLEDLEESGLFPARLEEPFVLELDLPRAEDSGANPSKLRVRLEGRIDRLDMSRGEGEPKRLRVLDYKTGGSLKSDTRSCLRGRVLQLPLYALAAGVLFGGPAASSEVEAELRGISPELSRKFGPFPRAPLSEKVLGDLRGPFLRTLGLLAGLVERGCFPFARDRHCEYCGFQAACPRRHPPSILRQESYEGLAAWRETTRKYLKDFQKEAGSAK